MNGKLHSLEYLTYYLKFIITNSTSKKKQAIKLTISLPSKRRLPSLGVWTVNTRAKNEEDATLSSEMENKCNEEWLRLINEGLEMK